MAALDFGNYPLSIYQDGNTFRVIPSHLANAEECAIDPAFSPDRLDIMKARGEAFGYTVAMVEPPAKGGK